MLYFLTVGQVKGFALFLGLATVLDLVATYFFMGPVIRLMARRDSMTDSSPALRDSRDGGVAS